MTDGVNGCLGGCVAWPKGWSGWELDSRVLDGVAGLSRVKRIHLQTDLLWWCNFPYPLTCWPSLAVVGRHWPRLGKLSLCSTGPVGKMLPGPPDAARWGRSGEGVAQSGGLSQILVHIGWLWPRFGMAGRTMAKGRCTSAGFDRDLVRPGRLLQAASVTQ